MIHTQPHTEKKQNKIKHTTTTKTPKAQNNITTQTNKHTQQHTHIQKQSKHTKRTRKPNINHTHNNT